MCTTVAIRKNGLYFGRNMDIEERFNEGIIHTPRRFLLNYRHINDEGGYAMLGIGTVIDGIPLYADGVNEKGLCMAGLNFLCNARYKEPKKEAVNLAPYEMIPYILRSCASVSDVKETVRRINVTDTPIDPQVPVPYLHFHVADKDGSIVIEPTSAGIKVYDNYVDVLTNNPPFPYHLSRLSRYDHLKNHTLSGTFYKNELYSLGLGAYGLPGDFSSASRFTRGAYVLKNLCLSDGEGVPSAFRVLESLSVPKGAVLDEKEKPHYTLYSCCIDAVKGTYYLRYYDSLGVVKAALSDCDPNGCELTFTRA